MRLVAVALLLFQAVSPIVGYAQQYDTSYAEAIRYVQEHGIAQGYADGTFGEKNTINRAELLKILMEATNAAQGGSYCFQDVANEWYAPYVCAARTDGMVTGYQDGTFHPERPVTFAEAAAITYRAYEHTAFTSQGPDWYMPYYMRLAEWNAVPQTMQTMHSPLRRGEMAYMVMMADRAHDGSAGDTDGNGSDVRLHVDASDDDISPGQEFTVRIRLENDGAVDAETTVTIEFDEGLELVDAEDADTERRDLARWNSVEVENDDVKELEMVAIVRRSARPGDRLIIRAETDEKVDAVSVTVGPERYETDLGDPVLWWNTIALDANATDHTGTYGTPEQGGPGSSSRALAIVQSAVYDAVNSIMKTHEPYIAAIPLDAHADVSVDAAVAHAAHSTLVSLYPKQRHVFDAALINHQVRIPDGSAKSLGTAIGQRAAAQMLAARNNDNSVTDYVHAPSPLAGRHRQDPINPTQPFMGAKWGNVTPFVIQNSTQFRSVPPPALASPEYAAAFSELILFGGDGITSPTIRTQDQTHIGIYWAYDGVKKLGTPPRLYNQITQVIARQRRNTVAENARLFALINIAQADGGIAAWESKYYYDLWRPIIGIREANGTNLHQGDGNPLTTGDALWTPLGAPMSNMTMNNFTPPFPAYPSGHATFGTAVFRVIERFYGTQEIPFTFVSEELNGVTTNNKGVVRPYAPRSFQNLRQAVLENAQSRIYLGVHWRFDQQAGMTMGREVADYVFDHSLEEIDE